MAIRRGVPNPAALVEPGPGLKVRLAGPTPLTAIRFELPLCAVMEVRGGVRRQGSTLEPHPSIKGRCADAAWSGEAQLAAVFGDSRINR